VNRSEVAQRSGDTVHCCGEIAANVDEDEERIVLYFERFREYLVPVRDTGTSGILMRFCPWCGTRLPESIRDEVLDREDRARGLTDA